jgi:lipocalin
MSTLNNHSAKLSAKQTIQSSVEKVAQLRQLADSTPGLAQAVSDVKAIQAKRFTGTYFDLLHIPQYKPATQFFLEELYSEKDYSQRDAQFSRIAGTLERMFPKQVVLTAVALAQLHSLTEELDVAMAQHWLNSTENASKTADNTDRYITAWYQVGRRADRDAQLSGALAVGQELVTLTRTPGLRMALKMMRKPATLAGLAALQHFLESGFDTFAAMGPKKPSKIGQPEGPTFFLETVKKREAALIDLLFDAPLQASKVEIERVLSKVA